MRIDPKILSYLKSLHMILTYFIASNISWRLTFMTVSFRIFIRNSWLLIGHDTAVWETKMKGNENHIHSSSVTDEFLIYFINQRCPNAHLLIMYHYRILHQKTLTLLMRFLSPFIIHELWRSLSAIKGHNYWFTGTALHCIQRIDNTENLH